MEYQAIGVVAGIYRFPVKSMQGEALQRGRLWWHGLDGDRRYAFVKTGSRSSFPWLTGRDIPNLIRHVPRFADPGDPVNSPILVRTPEGRELALESAELCDTLGALHGAPVHLLHLGRGTFDSMPLSIMSLSTVRALGERLGADVDPRRFRANVLVEAFEDLPHVEDQWIGRPLRFGDRPGSARVRANRPITRCMMVNLDPDTARQDPRVLRDLTHSHDTTAAIHASTEAPGTIEVGDMLSIATE
jgi:uncharacterized protein